MVTSPGEGEWKNWIKIQHPTTRVLEYLRRSVKPAFRVYNNNEKVWYLHNKFAESLALLSSDVTEQDAYALLHLRPTAPPAIIKAAWRELAKIHHPDKGGDPAQFIRIKQAYDSLIKE